MIRVASIAAILLPLVATAPPVAGVAALERFVLTLEQRNAIRDLAQAAVAFHAGPGQSVRNWGSGSCVHAALVNLLHWQEEHELAQWWREMHAGGETFAHMTAELDRCGIRWAGTNSGDESFLEAACATRRGAGVVVQGGAHMVCLVGLDEEQATIMDSNRPGEIFRMARADFLRTWHQAGGWAITPVYVPPAPLPWRVRKENEP